MKPIILVVLVASVALLSGCGVPCVETARKISGLEIPETAQINECRTTDNFLSGSVDITLTLSPAEYATVRAAAEGKDYEAIPPRDSPYGLVDFYQYYGEKGLAKVWSEPNGALYATLLRDSTRQVVLVHGG